MIESVQRALPLGDIVMMAGAWLGWGEDKGYLCHG